MILAIDVEPDESEVPRDRRLPWSGFERMVGVVRDLRPRLEDATGAPARFNWSLRMDAQIAGAYGSITWVADAYAAEIDELLSAGDGLGLHPHAWRWEDPPGRWRADLGDAAWIETVIRDSFAAFEAAFGRPCRSHRFGDRFISTDIVRILRDLGVRHDLTLEPGAPGLQRRAPRDPYRPSAADVMAPAVAGPESPDDLWMIPMTSFNPDPLLSPWRRAGRRLRHPGLPLHRPIGLATSWDPGLFRRVTADHLEHAQVPYLAFVLRSDVAARAQLLNRVTAKLEALLSDPLVGRLRFALPEDVVAAVALSTGTPGPPRA